MNEDLPEENSMYITNEVTQTNIFKIYCLDDAENDLWFSAFLTKIILKK